MSATRKIPVTVVRASQRRVEIRCALGKVLHAVDGLARARDVVTELERACGPGEQVETRLVGIHPDSWHRPLIGPAR